MGRPPAVPARAAPAAGCRHRRRIHLHRGGDRPLRRDGARAPGQLRHAPVRRRGLRGRLRRHQPGPRAGAGLHGAHGHRPIGERHHHRARHHAGHRADRRHGVDGGEPHPLPGGAPGGRGHHHDAHPGGGLHRHGVPGRVPHRRLRLPHPPRPLPRPHEVHARRARHDPRPLEGGHVRGGGLPHRDLPRVQRVAGAPGEWERPPPRPSSGARSPSWSSTTSSPSSPSADAWR